MGTSGFTGSPDSFCRADLQTALHYYQKALKVHPNEPHIFYNIGRLYFDMTQTEKAKFYFEKAIELDPNFEDPKAVLKAMELGAF